MMAEFNARNGDALATLVNDHGVQLHEFPEEVWKEIAEASEQVVADAGKETEIGTRIYDSYISFREKVRDWTRLADTAYDRYRLAALGPANPTE